MLLCDRESLDADALDVILQDSAVRAALEGLSRVSIHNLVVDSDHHERSESPSELGMPEHLQHPFRLYDEPIMPRIDILSKQKSTTGTYARPGYFAPFSNKQVEFRSNVGPKLLVLGLNGDLARRLDGVVCVRPFIENFMKYILQSVPYGGSSNSSGSEVFFWSTWMPHTAEIMLGKLRRICGNWEDRSLGVWTREDCGLDVTAYGE